MKFNKMENKNYSASSIKILEGLEAVRKRPSMYIGDVGIKGLHHLLWEVIDNSIDESLANYCTNIKVKIKKSNFISISDNGRGIPVEIHPQKKKSALEIVMTILHSGSKFNDNVYNISGGLHGVGISCVNALSEYLKVEVSRNGKLYQQEYKKGIPLYDLKKIGRSILTGTKVIFIPDKKIFKNVFYDNNIISSRFKELAYLNKEIKIELVDFRNTDKKKNTKTFYSNLGLVQFVEYLDLGKETILNKPVLIFKKKKKCFS